MSLFEESPTFLDEPLKHIGMYPDLKIRVHHGPARHAGDLPSVYCRFHFDTQGRLCFYVGKSGGGFVYRYCGMEGANPYLGMPSTSRIGRNAEVLTLAVESEHFSNDELLAVEHLTVHLLRQSEWADRLWTSNTEEGWRWHMPEARKKRLMKISKIYAQHVGGLLLAAELSNGVVYDLPLPRGMHNSQR